MCQNETTAVSAWNASEPSYAWEQASFDEAGAWAAEDDQFDGSFADEGQKNSFTLTGSQLNEGLASERHATCMTSIAFVVIIPQMEKSA